MGKLRAYISSNWAGVLTTILVLSALAFLLLFQLGSLTNFKISPLEAETIASASSLRAILDNSLYLPLKLVTYLLSFIPMDIVFLRLASSFVGGITAVYFYVILRKLHTQRVTALAITLFVTSSWFLQSARVITPVISSLYSVTALIFLSLWLPHARHKKLDFVFATAVAASLVYTPGFFLLLLLLVITKPKKFTAILSTVPKSLVILCVVMFVVMVAPLAYSLIIGTLPARTYLGVPLILEPIEWVKRLLIIPAYLFARGPLQPVFNVGRLPVLDIFTTILAVLGAYSYFYQRRLSRTGLLAVLTIFACVMIALNGPLWLPLLMPIVYILTAMGIAVLLQKWFTVFPRNPLARTVGITILCLALATVSVYHLQRYFIVWPNTTATKITFDQNN
jgi:hypothetical protein